MLKEVSKMQTKCCKETPLIRVYSDNSWSLWDFCPMCLDNYEIKNR